MTDEPWLARLVLAPLDRKKHDRAAFACGEARIDNFLKNNAADQADQDHCKVYVAIEPPDPRILGYYVLSPHIIDAHSLPEADRKKMPRHGMISAIYLSIIGVDQSVQNRGLGKFLLGDALKCCVNAANFTGGHFIVLDALNENAARLYRRIGFIDLPAPGRENRMLMTMAKVRTVVAALTIAAA
jgi:GNAT superfamily N-acetyltransferase